MLSCDQSLVALAFERSYHNKKFIRICKKKKNNYFKGVLFAQVQQFGADNRYSLEILNQSGKRVN